MSTIKEGIGGQALVPARPQRMVAGGGVFSEDGRGRAWTGPILSNLIIATEKKILLWMEGWNLSIKKNKI
jgi:hypothetical protein